MTRIIVVVLALLATAAPVATAMPSRDYRSGAAPTAAPQQDHRSPDARDASMTSQAGAAAPGQDLRTADARDAGTDPIAPASPDAAAITADDDTSPFVYILPGIVASMLLAVGMGYAARMSGRARRARIGT